MVLIYMVLWWKIFLFLGVPLRVGLSAHTPRSHLAVRYPLQSPKGYEVAPTEDSFGASRGGKCRTKIDNLTNITRLIRICNPNVQQVRDL